jgi:hypothetical protein
MNTVKPLEKPVIKPLVKIAVNTPKIADKITVTKPVVKTAANPIKPATQHTTLTTAKNTNQNQAAAHLAVNTTHGVAATGKPVKQTALNKKTGTNKLTIKPVVHTASNKHRYINIPQIRNPA